MKHTILFLAANPRDAGWLALDQEWRDIEHVLRNSEHFTFHAKWAVSIDDLMDYLNDLEPTVLHFSGHGSTSARRPHPHRAPHRDVESLRGAGIFLQDEDRSQDVSAPSLARMIASASPSTRLVVLNACYSADIADSLRQVVDCVIGIDGAIADTVARSFAVAFYRALDNRRSVGNAIAQAADTIFAKQHPDHLLTCRVRDGLLADQIFLVASGQGVTAKREPQVADPWAWLTSGLESLPDFPRYAIERFFVHLVGSKGKPQPFGGRSAELERLSAWLDDDKRQVGLVCGAPGQGKSTLLARWVLSLRDRQDVEVVLVPISLQLGTADFPSVRAMLAKRLEYLNPGSSPEQGDPEKPEKTIERCLTSDRENGRTMLVVLEGLDERVGWALNRQLHLPTRLGRHVKLVASARLSLDHPAETWRDMLPDEADPLVIELRALEAAGIQEAVASKFPAGLDHSVAEALARVTAGDPLLLGLYLVDLQQTLKHTRHISAQYFHGRVPGLQRWFDTWWNHKQQVSPDVTAMHSPRFLTVCGILCAAKGCLNRVDLLSALSEHCIGGFELQSLLAPVEGFLIGDLGDTGIAFSHSRIAELFLSYAPLEAKAGLTSLYRYCSKMVHELRAGQIEDAGVSEYVRSCWIEHAIAARHELTLDDLLDPAWVRVRGDALQGDATRLLESVRARSAACSGATDVEIRAKEVAYALIAHMTEESTHRRLPSPIVAAARAALVPGILLWDIMANDDSELRLLARLPWVARADSDEIRSLCLHEVECITTRSLAAEALQQVTPWLNTPSSLDRAEDFALNGLAGTSPYDAIATVAAEYFRRGDAPRARRLLGQLPDAWTRAWSYAISYDVLERDPSGRSSELEHEIALLTAEERAYNLGLAARACRDRDTALELCRRAIEDLSRWRMPTKLRGLATAIVMTACARHGRRDLVHELAGQLSDPQDRIGALLSCVPYLDATAAGDTLAEAIEFATTLPVEGARCRFLIAASTAAARAARWSVQRRAAAAIPHAACRLEATSRAIIVARELPTRDELGEEPVTALLVRAGYGDDIERAQCLVHLVGHMQDQRRRDIYAKAALSAIDHLEDTLVARRMYAALCPVLSADDLEIVLHARQDALGLRMDGVLGTAIAKRFAALAHVDRALSMIPMVPTTDERAMLRAEIAIAAGAPSWARTGAQACEAVRRVHDRLSQVRLLAGLSSVAPASERATLLQLAEDTARAIHEAALPGYAGYLASALTDEARSACVHRHRTMRGRSIRAEALFDVARRAEPERASRLLPEVAATGHAAGDHFWCLALTDPSRFSSEEELISSIATTVRQIADRGRAKVTGLGILLARYPPARATAEIHLRHARRTPRNAAMTVLRLIADRYAETSTDAATSLWEQAMRYWEALSRPSMLIELAALAPVAAAIGGDAFLGDLCDVVLLIGRRLP